MGSIFVQHLSIFVNIDQYLSNIFQHLSMYGTAYVLPVAEDELLLTASDRDSVILVYTIHSVNAVPIADNQIPLSHMINHEVTKPHRITAKVALTIESSIPLQLMPSARMVSQPEAPDVEQHVTV